MNRINDSYDFKGICPLCHHAVRMKDGILMEKETDGSQWTEVVLLQCNNCSKYFLFKETKEIRGNSTFVISKKKSPVNFRKTLFSETINLLSTEFVTIFNQADYASKLGLERIAGAGYRKALEFIVKDYAKMISPKNEETIIKSSLGKVIKDHIGSPKLVDVAKRAAWLGNDEVHYLRNWTEKDISDLKALIRLVVYYIDAEELAKKAIVDMPGGSD